MLLVIQIGLVIWAWMRGWKAWALLPIVFAVVFGFVLGFGVMIANPEMTNEEFNDLTNPITIVSDIIFALILLAMVVKGRQKPAKHTDTSKDQGP